MSVDQSDEMLTVAIANESAARVRGVMFAAARRQASLVGTLVTAITSFILKHR